MPAGKDFRRASAFGVDRVLASGRDLGRLVYWKLFAIENLVRVVIHSVLTGQVGPGWWTTAVDPTLQGKAQRFRAAYSAKPWHTTPGTHDIYYLDLKDLGEILRANSNLFLPVLPDIDQWIARLEQVRLPRNVVAHMNWPNQNDQQRIDVLLTDFRALVRELARRLALVAPK